MAFALGLAAIILPARIMFQGILDLIFAKAKPLSGGMTVVAALLALGAVLVSAIIGIAAATRGVRLIMSGIREPANQFDERRKLATGGRAA